MLFSDNKVASYLNNEFECAWESVREVPTLTLDLGNGKVVKRTLHGNVATFVCLPNGKVVDVLPGLYTPKAYIASLAAIKVQAEQLARKDRSGSNTAIASREYTQYHREALQSIKDGGNSFAPDESDVLPKPLSETGLDKLLRQDLELNEKTRRRKIHEYLLSKDLMLRPQSMSRWMYREVLHADLDDPYLGLKPLLTQTYPFERMEND